MIYNSYEEAYDCITDEYLKKKFRTMLCKPYHLLSGNFPSKVIETYKIRAHDMNGGYREYVIQTPTETAVFQVDKYTNKIKQCSNNNEQSLSTTKKVDTVTEPLEKEKSKELTITKPTVKKIKKFKVGEHYFIYPMNNRKIRREYVVKKTVYKILDKEVNIVIMKQINGSQTTKFTLNKDDCQKLHIKYEDGLEVFSMELDWKLIKNKK